jgi:hypothetical protein
MAMDVLKFMEVSIEIFISIPSATK